MVTNLDLLVALALEAEAVPNSTKLGRQEVAEGDILGATLFPRQLNHDSR